MRSLNFLRDLTSTLGRKLTAITALAAVVAFGVGPIEAGATSSSAPAGVAPGAYACSTGGSFTIAYEEGHVIARDLDTDPNYTVNGCKGTAIIPEGVTKIGLFQWNNDLLSVEIPASVTEIAGYAFAQSRNLASVSIATNSLLTRIPESAFGYTSLATIRVPARVTSIGSFAFENTSSLTSITFEANPQLQTIERGAFKGTTLSSISLPPSLTTLGNQVFENVASLNSVTFGEGSQLTTIGDNVFTGIGTINPPIPRPTIALPSTVTTIGRSPFGSNVNLTVPDSNQHFSIENGVLFNKNRTSLVAYATWLEDETYAIPASVTAIGPGAFEGSRLQRINIPSTVSTIGGYAFARSNQLSQLSFSANSSITTIPNEAFQSTRLESIEIPASVTIIQRYAFQDLQRAPGASSVVTQITFAPNSSLGEIQENAFSSARLSGSIQIPATVHTIGREAFNDNINLTSVTFATGSNLRQLGSSVFRDTRVSSLSLPTLPARSGYTLLGWSNTENGSVILEPAAAAESVIARSALYAVYQPHPTVTFNSNYGSAVANVIYAPGDAIEAPSAPTRSGYSFTGWALTDGGAVITFPFSPSSAVDFTLYALWTELATVSAGSEPNSQIVSIPVGLTAAEVPATANLPRVTLAFAATSGSASATIVPIENPAVPASTPFAVTSSTKIVDIQVSGLTGPVTVCLDGASTDDVFHYTGGAWVALPQRTFVNGQVCGVTSSFSPFTAAAAIQVASIVPATDPRISGRANKVVPTSGGTEFAIFGNRLAQISSVTLDGKQLTLVSKSDDQIVVKTPAHSAGFVDLVLNSGSTALVYQDAFEYRVPAAVKARVTTYKHIVVSSSSSKSLNALQQKSVRSFVASANVGAVLNCQATYVTKSEAASAKSLANHACAVAKKSNPYLTTRVLAPAIVKDKSARKVLLSLNR